MNILEIKNNKILARHVKDIKEAEFLLAQAEYEVLNNKVRLYEAEIELKKAKSPLAGDFVFGSRLCQQMRVENLWP